MPPRTSTRTAGLRLCASGEGFVPAVAIASDSTSSPEHTIKTEAETVRDPADLRTNHRASRRTSSRPGQNVGFPKVEEILARTAG